SVFNANVKNTRAFGSYHKPDIVSNDCNYGNAKDGNWFVGIATNVNGGIRSEAITLELTTALTKGEQYSLTFYARLHSVASNIEVGQSVADSLAGQVFYTISADNIGSGWLEYSIRFTALNNGKFISVRAINPNANSGVWLDGFKLNPVFQPDNVVMSSKTIPATKQSTEPVTQKKDVSTEIGLYPNPSEGIFKVNSDTSELTSLIVYNMLGSPVEQHVATPEQPVPNQIDLTDQQPGMYFVEMAMLNGGKVTKRIIVSR
ncbi:MAG: T9SS type A sorting domain-containing protein, partial [Bacteroidota bacterium]|nr:T9SS type A sorting domain-containing protein [Bacteroidota bacterium]